MDLQNYHTIFPQNADGLNEKDINIENPSGSNWQEASTSSSVAVGTSCGNFRTLFTCNTLCRIHHTSYSIIFAEVNSVISREVNSLHASEDIPEISLERGNDEPMNLRYICDESEKNLDVSRPEAGKSNIYFKRRVATLMLVQLIFSPLSRLLQI